jgi:hypothetical protein
LPLGETASNISCSAAPLRPIAPAARINAADTALAAGALHEMPVHDAAAMPRSFGDYELLEEIAEGGMGGVCEGWQLGIRDHERKEDVRSERIQYDWRLLDPKALLPGEACFAVSPSRR